MVPQYGERPLIVMFFMVVELTRGARSHIIRRLPGIPFSSFAAVCIRRVPTELWRVPSLDDAQPRADVFPDFPSASDAEGASALPTGPV